MRKFQVGEFVQSKQETVGQYLRLVDYKAGDDHDYSSVMFGTDAIGVVSSVDVPCVYHRKGYPATFLCVDYTIGNKVYRTRPYAFEVKRVRGVCLPPWEPLAIHTEA